jgi:hypothetical protein
MTRLSTRVTHGMLTPVVPCATRSMSRLDSLVWLLLGHLVSCARRTPCCETVRAPVDHPWPPCVLCVQPRLGCGGERGGAVHRLTTANQGGENVRTRHAQ